MDHEHAELGADASRMTYTSMGIQLSSSRSSSFPCEISSTRSGVDTAPRPPGRLRIELMRDEVMAEMGRNKMRFESHHTCAEWCRFTQSLFPCSVRQVFARLL